MSKTIQELTTQIEELEKRIRTISASQSSLSQIIAIRDCIEQIKISLEGLNDTLGNIENSASDVELEALKARVNICEEDISALQTDLATTQDNISTIQSDLNSTNTTVGEHTTTITNLQTTQTNLQTTQSSQASTINNINSRLTTAENNISTLTGGVDVSEIENRISELEKISGSPCFYKFYNHHNITPVNNSVYTKEFCFSCDKNDFVYQKIQVNYQSKGTGTLTFIIFDDYVYYNETFEIDLSQYPDSYSFERIFRPTKRITSLKIRILDNTDITYISSFIWVWGRNIKFYETNRDVKVACYNNKIFVTKYDEDVVRYGKFDTVEEIDLYALPLSRVYTDLIGSIRYAYYAPFLDYDTSSYLITSANEDIMFRENYEDDGQVIFDSTQELNDYTYVSKINSRLGNNEFLILGYNIPLNIHIREGVPKLSGIKTSVYLEYTNLTKFKTGEWLYVVGVQNNFITASSVLTSYKNIKSIMLNEDGYFYFVNNLNVTQCLKIAKGGNTATAYLQPDNTINVYINYFNQVDKYILTPDQNGIYSASFSCSYENCYSISEILDTHLLKETNNGWVIENV